MKLQDVFFSLQRPDFRRWWKWSICCAYAFSESWWAECPFCHLRGLLQPCSKGNGWLWQRGDNRVCFCWLPEGLWCCVSSVRALNVLRPNHVSSSHAHPLLSHRDVVLTDLEELFCLSEIFRSVLFLPLVKYSYSAVWVVTVGLFWALPPSRNILSSGKCVCTMHTEWIWCFIESVRLTLHAL